MTWSNDAARCYYYYATSPPVTCVRRARGFHGVEKNVRSNLADKPGKPLGEVRFT